jgi:hypothetical protein
MSKSPLQGLVIRTAVVRRYDLGFIYACNPKKEAEEIPHAIIFKWKAGALDRGECEYDAHTACVIEQPEPGLVDVSGAGYYSVNTRNGMTTEDIFENSQPPPRTRRLGGFRSVSEVEGKAYAVGLRGMVYRLDALSRWTRIDEGLPDSFNIQAIHGFEASDIYAVGRHGELWHYNGTEWMKRELPTNVNLTSVKCTADGIVYIGGHSGILIHGRGNTWAIIDHEETEDDIWDLEWFNGHLYVSTMRAIYKLNEDELAPVDFGDDPPKSCYQLSAAKGVMWSNGEYDIMSFDGRSWTRIV